MQALVFIFTALFGAPAFACSEDAARARVGEEARSLGGRMTDFVPVEEGVWQGVVVVRIQEWNGRIVRNTFVIDVDRRCGVDIWRAERR